MPASSGPPTISGWRSTSRPSGPTSTGCSPQAEAGPNDGALRIVLTRGGRRLLLTEPLHELPDRVRLETITYSPTRVLDGVKSLSYAANMLTRRLAREQGSDEALLVTPHGRVLEAPTTSIFWVNDGEIQTPPLDDHILASITRALVIDVSGATEQPMHARGPDRRRRGVPRLDDPGGPADRDDRRPRIPR